MTTRCAICKKEIEYNETKAKVTTEIFGKFVEQKIIEFHHLKCRLKVEADGRE